ncbi:MAG: 50S ribosomal protein L15 [Erysipelotrichaceae bacterium]|jgi:large subunit ribosomal protein L15|nr:50S ribosomal protein L15 [Erysipelotrichaceae bacterium]MCB9499759.1 50S ribosomal protein L15 [Erysipelotrichaceae bacterium]
MLNNLKPTEGSRKDKTRRCRGIGSGLGKNGGTGNKGQKSRGTGKVALGFEGGQITLWRRLPKRGFHNYTNKEFAIINLDVLETYKDGSVIDATQLISDGFVKKELDGLKVLGNGTLSKKLTVKANKFSATAKAAIEKAGGEAVVVE